MEMIFIIIVLISSIAGLSVNYFNDKKRKLILLNKLLSHQVKYEKIFITEQDGDGYQYLQIILNKKTITLALHFDIEKTCCLLLENNIPFSGKFKK